MISVPDGVGRVAAAEARDQHAALSAKLIRSAKRSPDILRNNISAREKLV
jgi:hypothetical protein